MTGSHRRGRIRDRGVAAIQSSSASDTGPPCLPQDWPPFGCSEALSSLGRIHERLAELRSVVGTRKTHAARPALLAERGLPAAQVRDAGLLEGAIVCPSASAFGRQAYLTLHEQAAASPPSPKLAAPAACSVPMTSRRAVAAAMCVSS